MRPLRLTYLVESLSEPWGGISTIRRQAAELAQRGHLVTMVSRTAAERAPDAAIEVRVSPTLAADVVPPSDLVIGTFVTTVPHAIVARRGIPVHFCQGLEGDMPEYVQHRSWVESVYRTPDAEKIVIAPHLRAQIATRFGQYARCVPCPVDHAVFHPRTAARPPGPLRVGVIGPAAVPVKNIAVAAQAADLAYRAGLDLVLVRVSPIPFDAAEPAVSCPVERHAEVPHASMGEILRSLDILVAASGPSEGFGLPVMEAMAGGVPCVLTDAPCFTTYDPEIDYAAFGAIGDAASLARALVDLRNDPERRQHQVQRGLAVAARHTWEAHVTALVLSFEGILGKHGVMPARRRRLELETAR